jgi:hypothetical protein
MSEKTDFKRVKYSLFLLELILLMNSFYTDLERGKQGENAVNIALTARGNKVRDVSGIYDYQRKDIDFIVSNGTNETSLEVKTDYKSEITGNLFIETYNAKNESRYGNGWFHYCEAEYICFAQLNNKLAHIVKLEDIKTAINNSKFRVANTSNTSGYLLPLYIVRQMPSYQKINLGVIE